MKARLLVAAAGLTWACVTVQPPPSSIAVCLATDCKAQESMPLFWGRDEPGYPIEPLAELQVDASELSGPGYGAPSRDEMLQALARKAKALGADALTHVEVQEVYPYQQPAPVAAMTDLTPPSKGGARGMAVRKRASGGLEPQH